MLKKVTACLLALLSINFLLFAQIADEDDVISSGEILSENYQVQHIQWKAVKRASGYEIELQVLLENGSWDDYDVWDVEAPEFDFKLVPGTYRFRISALNALGKKNGTSDWAEFDIFESTQPFLHRSSFPESSVYGIPVIRRTVSDENGTEVITVRGLHCFEPDTTFTLVPSDSSKNAAIVSAEGRSSVPLSVASSDPDNHIVRLTVDWGRLDFGSYKLVVESSTKESDYLDVIVQPVRTPRFTLADTYYDSVIRADCLDVSKNAGSLSLETENFQFDTQFILTPVTNADNAYPFESGSARSPATFGAVSGSGQVSVQLDSSSLKPGWYELFAETPEAGSTSTRFLIQQDNALSTLPVITDVSGKINVDTQMLAITIKADQALFSEEQGEAVKVYCISEKNEYGENKRTQLRMTSVAKNGKSAVYEILASQLEPAIYALMLETADSSRLVFIESDSKFKISMVSLSDNEIRQQFLLAPTDEVLAARAAERERLELAGLKYPESLPAFADTGVYGWYVPSSDDFPGDVSLNEDSVSFSVQNNKGNQKFSKYFYLTEENTIAMLRESEGISFESMVTDQNNGRSKWSFNVMAADKQITVPLGSTLNRLSQTVVKWEDYGIEPQAVSQVFFSVDVKDPHDPGWTNALEVYDAKTYSSIEPVKELVVKEPFLFTRVGAFAGVFLSDDSEQLRTEPGLGDVFDDRFGPAGFPASVSLNVYDCGWLALNAVYHPAGMGATQMVGGELSLSIPNERFRPYVGVGVSFWGESEWDELFAGAVLFNYVNIRYSMLNKYILVPPSATFTTVNPKGQRVGWSSQWLQIGLDVPLRKRTVHYNDSVEAVKKPILFTGFNLGFEMTQSVYTESSLYCSYLPDISFGVRALDLTWFALDASVAARRVPAENVLALDALDGRLEAAFILPFKMFKQDFGIEYALGGGYWYGLGQTDDHVVLSQGFSLRLGKYVKLKASFLAYESSWEEMLDLADDAPYLAPALCALMSDYWTIGINLTVPLRTK